ncbi:2820_t:CDS:2 [Dentiscutata erythropus]|uniref:2820_t:CDS:1 n=1 Tax=Dentiscutata erythropus TaxID=1348616 RepID=A0A9N9IZI5_9GLOM|nr:2820_t:CDS:2 [Dentiscutata erythropus]
MAEKEKTPLITPFTIAAREKSKQQISSINSGDSSSNKSELWIYYVIVIICTILKEGTQANYMFYHWCQEASKQNSFTSGYKYFKLQSLTQHIANKDYQSVVAAHSMET